MLPHRLVGSVLVGAAAAACAAGSRRTMRQRRIWTRLAIVNGLVLVELVCQFRLRLHDIAAAGAVVHGVYGSRRGVQALAIAMAGTIASVAMLAAARESRRIGAPAALATAATIALILLILIEAVSLHEVDAAFYRPVGPLRAVTWGWAACAIVTAAAALAARRRR